MAIVKADIKLIPIMVLKEQSNEEWVIRELYRSSVDAVIISNEFLYNYEIIKEELLKSDMDYKTHIRIILKITKYVIMPDSPMFPSY